MLAMNASIVRVVNIPNKNYRQINTVQIDFHMQSSSVSGSQLRTFAGVPSLCSLVQFLQHGRFVGGWATLTNTWQPNPNLWRFQKTRHVIVMLDNAMPVLGKPAYFLVWFLSRHTSCAKAYPWRWSGFQVPAKDLGESEGAWDGSRKFIELEFADSFSETKHSWPAFWQYNTLWWTNIVINMKSQHQTIENHPGYFIPIFL